jgi:hypothetical protein
VLNIIAIALAVVVVPTVAVPAIATLRGRQISLGGLAWFSRRVRGRRHAVGILIAATGLILTTSGFVTDQGLVQFIGSLVGAGGLLGGPTGASK